MTSPKPLAAVAVLAIGAYMMFHGGGAGLPVVSGGGGQSPSSAATSPSAPALPSPSPVSPSSPIVTLQPALPLPTLVPATPPPVQTPPARVDLARAQASATAFANTYVAYLYGKGAVRSVQNVTDQVRAGLPGTLGFISPAEQQRPYTITNVAVTPIEPEQTLAVVVTVSESGAVYNFSYTMGPQGTTWLTNAVPNFGN